MSIGKQVRRILGKRLFFKIAHYYRRFFVNLKVVAEVVSEHIPQNASILDVGGGDGALLNELLRIRPDVSIAAVDISHNIGDALSDVYRERVRFYPNTSTYDNHPIFSEHFDIILISDVMHHIPEGDRSAFIRQLFSIFEGKSFKLIIKDLEPGYIKSQLSLIADKFISGDLNTELISINDLKKIIIDNVSMSPKFTETKLMKINKPNYCLIINIE